MKIRLFIICAFVCLAVSPALAQCGGTLEQSTSGTWKIGPFLDETDGATAMTALTLSQADFRLAKNGGNMAQKSEATTATHDELGYYDTLYNTTDTATLGILTVMVHEATALPVRCDFMVVATASYEANVEGNIATVPTNFSVFSIDANGRIDLIKVAGTTQTAGDIPAVLALHDTMPRAVAYSNFPVWIMSNSTGAGIAGLTNITCRISKDGGAWATTNDTTETEVGGTSNGRGMYLIDLTGTEMTANTVAVECVSATANTSTYRTSITTQH